MLWEERPNGNSPDQELYQYYSKLAKIRKENKVLRTAEVQFEAVDSEPKVVIVKREDENGKIYTVLNTSQTAKEINLKLKNEVRAIDLLSGKEYQSDSEELRLKLEGYSTEILKIN
jgi:glycosidase